MDKRIAFLKKQMLANLQGSPSLQKMAYSVNLSEPHLQQLFKREVGMPPIHYLLHLRLEKARELLEESFLQIKQIGAEVGINDQSHFVRDFKKKYGLTPSEYRKQLWAKIEAEKTKANKS
jgi:transcriptional regulator GlxA family with amidase domain